MRVALVVMPFAAPDRPSLAAGLLQAGLERQDIACDTKYYNLTFWRMLGAEAYQTLAQEPAMTALAGEWIFSQVFYGHEPSNWDAYEREVLSDPHWGLPASCLPFVSRALATAPMFLRLAFESNDWSRYDLVGFTSTFEQTFPSLCLARMIRERHPGVLLAVGGANFEAEMGRPYMEHFPFLDFVSTGEADRSFPRLCSRIRDQREGRAAGLEVPAGFLYRRGGRIEETPRDGRFVDLDELPLPEYRDFFEVAYSGPAGQRTAADPFVEWLPVEASRGCWWGQKAHCTFCGLNGNGMAFRKKSWRKVAHEVEELGRLYGPIPLQFADNILGMDYFADLLPHWAERRHRVPKFFELKSNLKREQVRMLRRAGTTCVQAGVESLADGTLRVMRKGVSGAQNVAILRWCVEAGIEPAWNVIFGFPKEDLDDYERNLEILRKIVHLPPPSAFAPIRLDRFSPNFTAWREQGFTSLEPMPAYRHIFPLPTADVARLAYYFRYDHPQVAGVLEKGEPLARFGREWHERSARGKRGELAVKPLLRGGFVLIDSRFNAEPSRRDLSLDELAVLAACDEPVSRPRALRRAAAIRAAGNGHSPGGDLESVLMELLSRNVVAEIGPRLVTLALLPDREILPGLNEDNNIGEGSGP